MTHLGDAHNFGRRVELREGRVHKPRTLLWEWLLLSAESPLRGVLGDAFDFLLDLKFSDPHSIEGGEVQQVVLDPLESPDRVALARVTGRALALFTWLGLSDLHWENLVLGRDRDRIVFAPLDVEMILADLSSPTETKLLPDADPEVAAVVQHACGVRRVLPFLGKPIDGAHLVTVAAAYLDALRLLDRRARAIADVFASLPALRETPIRVLLRGTDEYVRPHEPLFDEEHEQRVRGDVPYFFRLYGMKGVHYWGDAALRTRKTIPMETEPLLRLSRGLRAPSRKRLREEGLFTVLGAFDHPANAGTFEADGTRITFKKRALVITPEKGDELETHRDLSAFVSSVYLPCRCGEVRTVFVPKVTVCE